MADDPTRAAPGPAAGGIGAAGQPGATDRASGSAGAVLAHLVYLDVDDEITSAAARIRTTDADQITLVLPYGSRLATSRINFRLLAREATERGKRLDIVCADASARALAAAAGLPVHASVAAYEAARSGSGAASNGSGAAAGAPAGVNASGPAVLTPASAAQLSLPELADDDTETRVIATPRRSSARPTLVGPARPPISPRIAAVVGVGVIAAVLVAAVLALQLLPSATIVLHPYSRALGPLSLNIEARPDVTGVDQANLVIPAQRFTFDLTATAPVAATGTKVTDVKATGTVLFSNFDNSTGYFVPVGTIVQTRGKDAVQFKTTADLTLPRAQVDFFPPFSTHPSQGTVGIEAVVAGVGGNVGNNTITDIPSAGKLLRVNNPDPTSGGAHSESPQITQDDVTAALTAINEALRTDLDAQVATPGSIPSGVTLFEDTKLVAEPEFGTDPQSLVGGDATDAELQATAQGSVLGVDQSPIQGIAAAHLQGEVDAGWTLTSGSTTVNIGQPSVLAGVITFPVTAAATEIRDVDRDALTAEIHGLGVVQARSRLETYGTVSISLWPDWVTTVPTNDDRVQLTIADPQPAASPAP